MNAEKIETIHCTMKISKKKDYKDFTKKEKSKAEESQYNQIKTYI